MKVTKVIFQNYNLKEDGIPPHWACQYFSAGYADYVYFETREEAYEFAYANGFNEE